MNDMVWPLARRTFIDNIMGVQPLLAMTGVYYSLPFRQMEKYRRTVGRSMNALTPAFMSHPDIYLEIDSEVISAKTRKLTIDSKDMWDLSKLDEHTGDSMELEVEFNVPGKYRSIDDDWDGK